MKTLSDCMINSRDCSSTTNIPDVILIRDVKQFIDKANERMCEEYLRDNEFTNPHHIINELAGDALCTKDEEVKE